MYESMSHDGQAPEGQFYEANRTDGAFWMEEREYERIRRAALDDLRTQGTAGGSTSRLGLYLRLMLRDQLAVRRDWTPSFDYRVALVLPPGASVVGLVGRIRHQPVYSRGKAGSAEAAGAGIELGGGLTQYVINFGIAANREATRYISPPMPL